MINEKSLNLFEAYTNYIPVNKKNSQSVKLMTHKDLDGMVSAILIVNQLGRQGIPKNRIEIGFGQYGDSNLDLLKNTSTTKKGQKTVVSDFAALPKEDYWKVFNKTFGFKGDKQKAVELINERNWAKVRYNEFSNYFKKKFNPTIDKWYEESAKTLFACLQAYSRDGKHDMNVSNIETYGKINLSKPDFVTDHHNNGQGRLYGGKYGEIAVSSKSNAGYIARHYCTNIMNSDDIEAVDMIDSAGYTKEELENTLYLVKKFTGKDKKRNLAIMANTLAEQLIKKNEEMAVWVIKNAQPSLVSIYNSLIKASKFNGMEYEAYKALGDGDMAKVKEIQSKMPDVFTKHFWRNKGRKWQPINNLETLRNKNLEDFEAARSGHKSERDKAREEELKAEKKTLGRKKENAERVEAINKEIEEINSKKGKLFSYKNVMIQDASNLVGYPTRFQPALASVDGKRKPCSIKMFPDFIQVSKNPLYDGDVDFFEVGKKVIKDLPNYLKSIGLNEFTIKQVMDEINDRSGGHKAIYSLQGFDKIQPKYAIRNEYYTKRDWVKKATERKMKDRIPNMVARLKELEDGEMEKYKRLRKLAMQFAVRKFIDYTEQMYPVDSSKFNGNAGDEWNIRNN